MVGERDRAVWEGEELKAANLRVGAGRDGECWVCMLSEVDLFCWVLSRTVAGLPSDESRSGGKGCLVCSERTNLPDV